MRRTFFDSCFFICPRGNHIAVSQQRGPVMMPESICFSARELTDRFLPKLEASAGVFVDGRLGGAIYEMLNAWRRRPLGAGVAHPPRLFIVPPTGCLTTSDFAAQTRGIWGTAASIGGPAEINAASAGQFGVFSDDPVASIDNHPAIVAGGNFLKFNNDAIPRLFRLIGDPRWHIDPQRPDSLQPLQTHLGLSRLNISDLDPLHRQRFAAVVSSWYHPRISRRVSVRRHRGMLKFFTGEHHWRDFSRHLKHGHYRALRRGSIKFIQFLRQCWLQGLYSKTTGTCDRFIDESFFQNDFDRRRFRAFLESEN